MDDVSVKVRISVLLYAESVLYNLWRSLALGVSNF